MSCMVLFWKGVLTRDFLEVAPLLWVFDVKHIQRLPATLRGQSIGDH